MNEKGYLFANMVKAEYAKSQDAAHVAKLKAEAELAKETEKLNDLKSEIVKAAKEGKNRYMHDIDRYNKWTVELLEKELGLKVIEEENSGSCGNHGYDSYYEHYFLISW